MGADVHIEFLMEPNQYKCYLISGTEFSTLERKYYIVNRLIYRYKSTNIDPVCDVYHLSIQVLSNTVNILGRKLMTY